MHIYALVAALAAPDGECSEVIAEACATDFTGNFQEVARKLIAKACRTDINVLKGDELRRSYSAESYTFNYVVHPGSQFLFLCLSDDASTIRESFRFLETVKKAVLGGVNDFAGFRYFEPICSAACASWSPTVEAMRREYAAAVRSSFRTVVSQWLREAMVNYRFPVPTHVHPTSPPAASGDDVVDVVLEDRSSYARTDSSTLSSASSLSPPGWTEEWGVLPTGLTLPAYAGEPLAEEGGGGTRRAVISDSTLVFPPEGGEGRGLLPPPPYDRMRKACVSDGGLRRRGSGVSNDGSDDVSPTNLRPSPLRSRTRIRGLRVRKSGDGVDKRECALAISGGDREGLPPAVGMKVKDPGGLWHVAEQHNASGEGPRAAILLPMDYSGMKDEVDELTYGEHLLRAMDVQVKLALQAQVAIADSVDSFLTVLHMFRDALKDIPLPPPTSVDLQQAIKDAQREAILLNGVAFKGDASGLEAEMLRLVKPFVAYEEVEMARLLCQDILRASSRTASGGDSYSITQSLLVRRGNLLTPANVECAPISITISPEGVVDILSESSFALHRNMMPELAADQVGSPADPHKHRRNKSKGILGGFLQLTPKAPSPSDEGGSSPEEQGAGDLILATALEVRLDLLQRSSKRRIRIRCGEVEKCPQQFLVLGSGEVAVNGAYEMQGFRARAPLYAKPDGTHIVKECALSPATSPGLSPVKGQSAGGWAIMSPTGKVYYRRRSGLPLPPSEAWEPGGDDVANPPPTLMPNFSPQGRRNSRVGPSPSSPDLVHERPTGARASMKTFPRFF